MFELSWVTCRMRSLRTFTACGGASESYTSGVSGSSWRCSMGTYQQGRIIFALQIHGEGSRRGARSHGQLSQGVYIEIVAGGAPRGCWKLSQTSTSLSVVQWSCAASG
jgi:hypothetical protein